MEPPTRIGSAASTGAPTTSPAGRPDPSASSSAAHVPSYSGGESVTKCSTPERRSANDTDMPASAGPKVPSVSRSTSAAGWIGAARVMMTQPICPEDRTLARRGYAWGGRAASGRAAPGWRCGGRERRRRGRPRTRGQRARWAVGHAPGHGPAPVGDADRAGDAAGGPQPAGSGAPGGQQRARSVRDHHADPARLGRAGRHGVGVPLGAHRVPAHAPRARRARDQRGGPRRAAHAGVGERHAWARRSCRPAATRARGSASCCSSRSATTPRSSTACGAAVGASSTRWRCSARPAAARSRRRVASSASLARRSCGW